MKIKDQIRDLRQIEYKINRHLYLICAIVTVLLMIMILIEFFTRGAFPPIGINTFYLGVLIIYSVHKELVRWLGEKKIERQGEYFVYIWIFLVTFLYFINFLSKNYFRYSAQGEPLPILKDVSILALEILAVFIFTRGLKILKILIVKTKN